MSRRPALLSLPVVLVAVVALAADTPAVPEQPQRRGSPLHQLPYAPSLDIASMDSSADPCVDFYRYACGGWTKSNPIPPDQSSWSVYEKLYEENTRFLWGILDEASRPAEGRSGVERQIGDYFAACMDETTVEKADADPLAPALKEIAASASFDDIARFLARQHLAGSSGAMMFGFGSSQDYDDSTQFIAFATAGGLGLPDRDYYVTDDPKSQEIRQRYVAHVQGMLELLGDPPEAAASAAQAIMRLETALAKSSLTRVERRDPSRLRHRMKRAELQALTPDFNWELYLETAGLPRYEVVNVTEPEFYRELERQLRAQDLATWKGYLRWHLVNAKAPYLSTRFVQPDFEFYRKYLRGVGEIEPRWKRCVQWVDRDLGEELGQVFVQRTVGPAVKQRALQMTVEIQRAMEQHIKQLAWMGPETKKQALDKLHAMVNKIGYPDRWRDYSSIAIGRQDFFGNVERSTLFESRRQLAKIGAPIDRGEWHMTPPTVNAYYDPQMNDMNFPAGVLQPPLFDVKMDDAPNYGDTGATIGHELTHGFDDEGRQFDAHGNLRDWWSTQDANEFGRRTSCVSSQYSQYVAVDDIRVNGKLTLGEDVADLGGTILAYDAWKSATRGQDLQPVDGFTPDQRFFIGMAQWACSNATDEDRRLRAITDPHSPESYRVNGVVANMPEFAQAFGCKPGQPMVRESPCRVW